MSPVDEKASTRSATQPPAQPAARQPIPQPGGRTTGGSTASPVTRALNAPNATSLISQLEIMRRFHEQESVKYETLAGIVERGVKKSSKLPYQLDKIALARKIGRPYRFIAAMHLDQARILHVAASNHRGMLDQKQSKPKEFDPTS